MTGTRSEVGFLLPLPGPRETGDIMSLTFEGKVAGVTGDAHGIGKCVVGENICIDGGMTRQMICHGDHGWKLEG